MQLFLVSLSCLFVSLFLNGKWGICIFELTFYGTRGSTPVSGTEYRRYGGNTTCIALRTEEGQLLIVDGGTGLLRLQKELFGSPRTGLERIRGGDLFFTHVHWDHVQGVAFFAPFFSPEYSFRLYSENREDLGLREQLEHIFHAPTFPIGLDAFGAHLTFKEIHCRQQYQIGAVLVETTRLTHPNRCTGYRFTLGHRSVCIISDYEHGGDAPISFAHDTDVLIYDAQYCDEEYSAKKAWGHSTWQQGCAFALECGAKRLFLTHHDPFRSDDSLDKLQLLAQHVFPKAYFAYDGLTVTV